MKKLLILVLIIYSFVAGSCQAQKDDFSFKERLQPLSGDNIFKTDDYYNWCSSTIKGEDGKYHLFYSRWKKADSFPAWLTFSEVAHAVSNSPAGPWEYKETVLKGRGKGHWDAVTAHNPKIKFFDGKYYLYYISTNMGDKDYSRDDLYATHGKDLTDENRNLLRENQRTGVAVSNSINGPWKRMNQPLIEPSGPITTLTVNPAIDKGKDGKFYMIVKGDKPNETRFIRNQAVAISDSPTGPFAMQEKPVIDNLDTEDVSLWYDKQRDYFYGIFHAHVFIGMVSSPDGINWGKATEYEVMKKKVPMTDGTFIEPGRMERPYVYRENGEPKVLSLAVGKDGDAYIIFVPIEAK